MAYTTTNQLKDELLFFLRNKDILTTTQRGVTTSFGTAVLSSETSMLLGVSNTKNIRDIDLDGSTLVYGTDYVYDIDYDNSGTKDCKITFTASQSGTATVQYDSGSTDKIFPDYPQPNLKLNAFPRIAFDIISGNTKENEIGAGSNDSEYVVSISTYSKSQRDTESMISDIRENLMENKKSFYFIRFITPSIMSPMIPSPFGEQKVMQRSQDFKIRFIYEY